MDSKNALGRSFAVIAALKVWKSNQPTVSVMAKPTPRVFAGKNYDKGGLVIAPVTAKIQDIDPSVRQPATAVAIAFKGDRYPQVSALPDGSKTSYTEFWSVRCAQDRKRANAEEVSQTVALTDEVHGGQVVAAVPCVVNFKAIKEGEEVILYKTKVDKHAGTRSVSSAKRAKTA